MKELVSEKNTEATGLGDYFPSKFIVLKGARFKIGSS